jgi:hypothetical protein
LHFSRGFNAITYNWRPDSLLVRHGESLPPSPASLPGENGPEPAAPPGLRVIRRLSIIEVNAVTRHSRTLATLDETMKMFHSSSGRVFPNRRHSSVAMTPEPFDRNVRMVWDLVTNKRHGISRARLQPNLEARQGLEFLGWMPDDENMLFRDYNFQIGTQNLYAIPVDPEAQPHLIGLAQKLDELREKGVLTPDEDSISYVTYLGPADNGRSIRIFILFACPTTSTDPKVRDNIAARERETESSIWDFNLETEELTRILTLGRNAVRRKETLFSPSGASALDVLITRAKEADTNRVYPTRPVFYTVGKPGQEIPLDLPLPGTAYHQFFTFQLGRYVRFLDDHTLLYVGKEYSLWTFDTRSNRSEQIWHMDVEIREPLRAGSPPPREKKPVPPAKNPSGR